jgi:hypothetical protein
MNLFALRPILAQGVKTPLVLWFSYRQEGEKTLEIILDATKGGNTRTNPERLFHHRGH